MRNIQKLANYNNPLVAGTAIRLTHGEETARGKLEKLFYYVRDEIKFGFLYEGDFVKASETIRLGIGNANTKGTLLISLCLAVGIPARLHFATAHKEIECGIFKGLSYATMPGFVSLSWAEVEIEDTWRRLDSYVLDNEFMHAAALALADNGWKIGYGLAPVGRSFSSEFNIDRESFCRMGAAVADHGAWVEPAGYYTMGQYVPVSARGFFYRMAVPTVNERIEKMRKEYRKSVGKVKEMPVKDAAGTGMEKSAAGV